MSLHPDTAAIQRALARYCRTGFVPQLPGVVPGRLVHYRRLVRNVVFDNLEEAFPIASKYIGEERWEALCHAFLSDHACLSPQVWQIAGEFYRYALNEQAAAAHALPFLNDLLLFEWTEMELYNMPDLSAHVDRTEGDLLNDRPVLNPEHRLLTLQYPAHLCEPWQALEREGRYFVLLFREPDSGKIQFMDLSVWFALLVEQFAKEQTCLRELLDEAPALFGSIDLDALSQATLAFMEQLRHKQGILGFRDAS